MGSDRLGQIPALLPTNWVLLDELHDFPEPQAPVYCGCPMPLPPGVPLALSPWSQTPRLCPTPKNLERFMVTSFWGNQGYCHLTKPQKYLWDGSSLGEQMDCRPYVERRAEF